MKTLAKKQNTKTPANDKTGRQGQNSTNGQAKSSTADQAVAEREESPFEKLFMDLVKDIYWAEQHLVTSLPKMINAATTTDLQDAFDDHLHLTKKHVNRLERVFNLLGQPAQGKKCAAIEGLVKEAEEMIKMTKDNTMTRDAGLIISAQKIEHYEIAAYGSLVQVALTLGYIEVAGIFERTLRDEEDADRRLTVVAETEVNPLADEEGEGDEQSYEEEE